MPQISIAPGISVPQLGVGTYKLEPDAAYRIVRAALEKGYRHIDTAKLYNNEEAVGRAVRDSGIDRKELWITTKLWHDEYADPVAALNRSLERLGMDYVDLYLIHWPVPLLGTAWDAWHGLVAGRQQGLSRSIGVSNFEIEHLERIIADSGVLPAVNQIELHPEHQRRELVAYCRSRGIVVQAWSPLARARQSLLHAPAVLAAATAHKRSAAQIILRWHVQHGFIVFPKTAREERLKEHLEIFDFVLDATEMAALDALEIGLKSGSGPYEVNG